MTAHLYKIWRKWREWHFIPHTQHYREKISPVPDSFFTQSPDMGINTPLAPLGDT